MPTVYIEHFGCRATQADAAAIARAFLQHDYRLGDAAEADVIVVNTCTVTQAADAQARQAIRAFHRRNPTARIVVTGCYAQRAPEELAQLEGVSWVVGNSHQLEIPHLLARPRDGNFVPLAQLSGKGVASMHVSDVCEQPPPLMTAGVVGDRTRPTVKVQDGCDMRCAFCILPQVRGHSRSVPPEQVLAEVNALVAAGAREIVLSGINLGQYGRDCTPRLQLRDLLARLLEDTAVERLRLSSLEPTQLTADLLRFLASSERIARHFHIPLQSGSDRVLRAMHRWYRAEHYRRRVELVFEHMPEAAVGADVLAGFPGETEEDHQQTMRLIEQLPLAYLHVFPYSPRPGTEAAARPDPLPAAVVRRRARELRQLGEAKAAAFRRAQIGRIERALTLQSPAGRFTEALTGNYLRVRLAERLPANRWCRVRLLTVEADTVWGERVDPIGLPIPLGPPEQSPPGDRASDSHAGAAHPALRPADDSALLDAARDGRCLR